MEVRTIRRLSSLTSKNLRIRKTRTALTTIGIILGVAVILGISITNISTVAAFTDMIDSITGKSDFTINSVSESFDEKTLDEVDKISGVEVAAPGISRGSRLTKKKEKPDVRIIGIDPSIDRKVRDYSIANGEFLKSDEGRSIIIVEEFAKENKIKVGDKLELATDKGFSVFSVIGLLDKTGVGRFQNGSAIFMPLKTAQNEFNLDNRLTFIDVISTKDDVEQTIKKTKKILGGNFVVERPAKRVEAMEESLKALQIGLSFFSAVALFVGGFLIFNTLSMVVIERTKELGLLRSIGASRSQLATLILTEALIIGFIGSVIGLIAGLLLARGLIYIMSETIQSNISTFEVPLRGLIASIFVGIVISVIASLQPALTASRIPPLMAIRTNRGESSSSKNYLLLISSLLIIVVGVATSYRPQIFGYLPGSTLSQAGAFLLLLGVALLTPFLVKPFSSLFSRPFLIFARSEGRLASRNLSRTRGRTAATISAIMISLAMLLSVGGLTDSFKASIDRWVEKSIGADVFVAGEPFDLSIDKRYIKEFEGIKGVKSVSPVRFFFVRVGDQRYTWRAIEPETFRPMAELQFVEGKSDQSWEELDKGDSVFLSTVLANRLGLSKGDEIKIKTDQGERSFNIAGIIIDFGGETGDVIVGTRSDMKKYFGFDDVNSFRIKIDSKARPRTVAKRIEKQFGDQLSLEIEDIQEFKSMINKQINVTFAAFNVITLIAVIVAAVGIINTMMMNIMERTREIGILKAIGGTRWQIRKIILIEASITGSIGLFLGVIVGIFMSISVIQSMHTLTGYDVTYVFPWSSLAASAFIALIFSTIIALLPAQIAASSNIVEAIHYE